MVDFPEEKSQERDELIHKHKEVQDEYTSQDVVPPIEPIERSKAVLVLQLFLALLVLDVFYAVINWLLLSYAPEDLRTVASTVMLVVQLLKLGAMVYIVLYLILGWTNTHYYLAGHYLVKKEGVINTSEKTYELRYLRSVVVKQSWIGQMLNYGDMELLISEAGLRDDVRILFVANPRRYEQIFKQYLGQTPGDPTPPPPAPSIDDKIK